MSSGFDEAQIRRARSLQAWIDAEGFGPSESTEHVLERLAYINDSIQAVVSRHGVMLPEELLKLLGDLDWFVINGGRDTRRS